ncbi:ABC transporter permease [Pyrococcus abyssi]|uniref:DppC-1 dipeptide transport system permease protein dppC or oligopeptide transport system permease protein oppC n=1 Tax=Pyrococcus abyssi (strain GE5 / Orsay) TaxID=272844 RepID=Q9UXV9_PYRAB|nr:ABC transporter permease [Pyrococcus abyssi]CAB50654.1 dppC-1 dipeptide transport system permease protein dppC or oligopeptide transport system permease protein oppC [Pyrococcus abyssi GE5]CCE71223.1 TPA: oligopeptide ABC transporter, permease protein [Pyrococcus abyssi GE5]
MRWVDIKDSLANFWFEFRRQKGGLLGLFLLTLLVVVALAAPILTSPDIPQKWKLPWEDTPKAVPPVWYNWFAGESLAPHKLYTINDVKMLNKGDDLGGGVRYYKFEFKYDFNYDVPPSNIIIKGIDIRLQDINTKANLVITVHRPDGKSVEVYSGDFMEGMVIQLASDDIARSNIISWASQYESRSNLDKVVPTIVDVMKVLFGKAQTGILINPEPLKGTYTFDVELYTFNPEDQVNFDNLKIIFTGRTYGYMGTDDKGRDLWAGLVWGTRISLIIGISVAVLSVLFGVLYGVTSAYLGGWTDEMMMRFQEFMASIPTLPILIMLASAFKGHVTLGIIVLLLVVFGWVGIARVSRSMALQIKEQTYVEAAIALGAGTGRIIFKHIMPQLLPYAFAQIALSVPGAVLTEAGLSYLGLGDPTAVTWGQILHDAQAANATINGYWWWVIPPGLAIALVSLTFVLLGTALDRVLNPRLRRL